MSNITSFKKGHIPYNKGMKTGSFSKETEFKKGVHSFNFKGYGTPFIRKEKGRRPEVYTTVSEKRDATSRGRLYKTRKRTTMARFLWKQEHGDIPKNRIVYNTNQSDPVNIELNNLILITRGELMKINKN